ncbi:hypothetical protein D6C83_08877 [Aureobasidium pullulans]|uniref:Uncharacterized protein n=1 Tax=Aureobasidium pullulans TaxID=5580 RepID=A0A4S9ZBN6_AURPU|nr:hypothetical protein D6C83_08877 [Aureobasidium pullulans]
MPAVPWVLDCGLANTAKPDVIVNQRNLNRLSDTVKALVEIPDHLTQATHLADEFRRDLLPLSMNLPYSATHTLVKEVNILLVQIPSYARDLDANLRLINYTTTQLLRESTKGTQADDSVPSREPWRGVGTIWGGFHNQVVTHFSIFITEFAKMHHKSEMLLLICQIMSDSLETLRIETEQSQSNQAEIEQANKAIRFWKFSTTLDRDSTHALKMKRSTVRSTSTPPQAKNEMSKSVIPNEQANSKSTPLFEQQAEMCNILGILVLISTSRFWLFTTRLWTRAVTFAIAVQSTTETFVNRLKNSTIPLSGAFWTSILSRATKHYRQ